MKHINYDNLFYFLRCFAPFCFILTAIQSNMKRAIALAIIGFFPYSVIYCNSIWTTNHPYRSPNMQLNIINLP